MNNYGIMTIRLKILEFLKLWDDVILYSLIEIVTFLKLL